MLGLPAQKMFWSHSRRAGCLLRAPRRVGDDLVRKITAAPTAVTKINAAPEGRCCFRLQQRIEVFVEHFLESLPT